MLIPSSFASIPISEENWRKVVSSLYIPKYYVGVVERGVSSLVSVSRLIQVDSGEERLQMTVGTSSFREPNGFALGSTYFPSRRFTCAIIVGCTDDQVEDVKRLIASSKASSQHPLLMLGIFAELDLSRLKNLVYTSETEYADLSRTIEIERYKPPNMPKFGLDIIQAIATNREHFQTAQQEIESVRLQLERVSTRQINEALREKWPDGDNPDGETRKQNLEFTQRLSDRLEDIINRLDGFSAQCRVFVDGISFSTELVCFNPSGYRRGGEANINQIRGEFAREEANQSVQNTRLATVIAFVALVYLPITGVAVGSAP